MIPFVNLIDRTIFPYTYNDVGSISNSYAPFSNLINSYCGDFTTTLLNFDLEHPVDILVQDAYDGAVNLIINDGKNIPRLINSRFSILDNNTFLIPDHYGIKDTNLYNVESFDVDTALKAIPLKIPKIEYLGLYENQGDMKCGSYTFYFKLCDADDNETEIIAESGIVQCHIGRDLKPSEMRMGMQNENSRKSINFKLTNIDSGFNYVKVYYCRTSTGNSKALSTTYHKIDFKYPVDLTGCVISITGEEKILDVTESELYVNYADINSVKTQEQVNNLLLFGNSDVPVHDWDELRKASWKIIPSVVVGTEIGDITSDYEFSDESQCCYYSTKNVYEKVGYWPDEIYRFGIVYIFTDNSLSPVFNIQGIDFNTLPQTKIVNSANSSSLTPDIEMLLTDSKSEWEYSPEDCFFNKKYRTNSKGVIKMPNFDKFLVFKGFSEDSYSPQLVYLKFNFDEIALHLITTEDLQGVYARDTSGVITKYYKSTTVKETNNIGPICTQEFFKYHDIKGFFFVRQKRIPTILCQGIAVNLLDKDRGAVPFLNEMESFLTNRMLKEEGSFISKEEIDESQYIDKSSCRALFIPDAELVEATYNSIFTSSKFSLHPIGKGIINSSNNVRFVKLNNFKVNTKSSPIVTKLTNVPEDTFNKTDGENYFATVVGSPDEVTKCKNAKLPWKKSLPMELTKSSEYIRGKWGAFVGSSEPLQYGMLYNIKLEQYGSKVESDLEATILLDFQNRFNDESLYFAICDRTSITELEYEEGVQYAKYISCFRGDCFFNMFTHRVHRNFYDTELPTNNTIIDPACWVKNYLVLSTAYPALKSFLNAKTTPAGFGDRGEFGKGVTNWAAYVNEIQKADHDLESNVTDTVIESGIANKVCDTWEAKTKLKRFNANLTNEDDSEDGDGKDLDIITDKDTDAHQEDTISAGVDLNDPGDKTLPADIPDNFTVKKLPPKEGLEGPEIMGINVKALFKSSKNWELRGIAGINRADVNAVGTGQWFTFPVCSNYNYAMRDVDFNNATEEATFNRKRSFYPLAPRDIHNKLRDSNVINGAAATSIPNKGYIRLPDAPFIKQEYFTRVYTSAYDDSGTFTNEFKLMLENSYLDYTKIYGSITKITALGNYVYVIFKHGIGVFNITTQMASAENEKDYLAPTLSIISDTYGSIWKDSIYNTGSLIYGVDSVAKVIWAISGSKVTELSALTAGNVGKWLVDNLDMSEFQLYPYVGHVNIKTHYNAAKGDVMFTYYNDIPIEYKWNSEWTIWNPITLTLELDETKYKFNPTTRELWDIKTNLRIADLILVKKWKQGKRWVLNYNESMACFTTFYDWYPLESANIDNIYFSFDRDQSNELMDRMLNNIPSNNLILPTMTYTQLDKTLSINDIVRNHYSYSIKKYTVDESCTNTTELFFIKPNYNINKIVFDFDLEFVENTLYAYCIYMKTDSDININFSNGQGQYTINKNFIVQASDDYLFIPIFFKTKENVVESNLYRKLKVTVTDVNKSILQNVKFLDSKLVICNFDNIVELIKLGGDEDIPMPGYPNQTFLYYPVSKNNVPQVIQNEINNKEYIPIRDTQDNLKLWKHGLAGIYDNQGSIKPTNWYGKQHEFNFEFVVNQHSHKQKIFNNLLIVSNKVEPNKFEFEVVGESYIWRKYKKLLQWISDTVEQNPQIEFVGGNGDYIFDGVNYIDNGVNNGDYKQNIQFISYDPVLHAGKQRYTWSRIQDKPLPDPNGNLVKEITYDYVGFKGDYVKTTIYKLHNDENTATHCYEKNGTGIIPINESTQTILSYYVQDYIYEYKGLNKGNYINNAKQQLYLDILSNDIAWLINKYPTFPVIEGYNSKSRIKQLPYLDVVLTDKKGLPANDKTYISNHKWSQLESWKNDYGFNCGDTVIVQDKQLNEYRIRTELLGNDLNKYGRIRGNLHYLEDVWRIEIRPISFYLVSLQSEKLYFSEIKETRLRDKYIKIKVRYSGEDLAIIQQILTLYDISYA